jgi:hypothetical protein
MERTSHRQVVATTPLLRQSERCARRVRWSVVYKVLGTKQVLFDLRVTKIPLQIGLTPVVSCTAFVPNFAVYLAFLALLRP